MQTSYSPLYSSALHNRFVHSLGVFYLGSIAANRLTEAILDEDDFHLTEEEKEIAKKLSHVFRLACLLHDVGHAPFSHTGEIYYIYNKNENGEEFSGLIGNKEYQEFFARCITGYTYKDISGLGDIKNCFIGMLNSKVIDVDRLDYLIRDAYTSGFATINIDYVRLLKAITIKEYMDKKTLAYSKDAVSVIENVVYAHDAEKKWIQNHPIVLYEAYIRSVGTEEEKDLFKACMDSFNDSNIPDHPVPLVIDETLLEKLEKELDESKKRKASVKALSRKVYACKYMKQYADEHGMPFDYLIIPTSMFSSSFSKGNLRKVLVNFEGKRPMPLKDVCKLLKAEKSEDDKDFYYLFYRRCEPTDEFTGKIDDVEFFCNGLVKACLKDDISKSR